MRLDDTPENKDDTPGPAHNTDAQLRAFIVVLIILACLGCLGIVT
jgi:hypothetical protein